MVNKIKNFYNDFKLNNPENYKIKLIFLLAILSFVIWQVITNVSKIHFNFDFFLMTLMFPVLIISVVLHELGHGYSAYFFGDDTAKRDGRLTFNPLKHIDIKGLLLPLILLLSGFPFIIGFAKPVPVDFSRLRPQRLGIFVVAIAGIVINVILAIIAMLIYRQLNFVPYSASYIIMATTLSYFYFINIGLAAFNLIPIPPLDGSRIVYSFSGDSVRRILNEIEKYGFFILIALLYFGPLNKMFDVVYNFLLRVLNGG